MTLSLTNPVTLGTMVFFRIISRDYAASLAVSVPRRFWSLFGRVKSPKRSSSRSQFFSSGALRAQDSTFFEKSYFSLSFRVYPILGDQMPYFWEAYDPGQHRPVVVHQGNGRGHMDIPSPGMIRNPGAHLEQIIGQSGWIKGGAIC